MGAYLDFEISPQPDETTCGPACLHSIYRYYGQPVELDQVIEETPELSEGGTLGVFLACHALSRGFRARIYTYNLQVFDPIWFTHPGVNLAERLQRQMEAKADPKLHLATRGYLEFLRCGGEIRLEDLRPRLIRDYLKRGVPVITGLSATYLYREPREFGPKAQPDDVRGEAAGHFVVLHGYHKDRREIHVADPLHANPLSSSHYYSVSIERVICAILLGLLTYDANLLIIQPPIHKGEAHADSGCGEQPQGLAH